MGNTHLPYGLYERYFKRLLDFSCGIAVVVLFSWLYLILILLGAIFMRGNPFFTQQRPGKDGEIFKLIKFRSMDNRRDKNGELLPDAVRLNKYGRFIRKTSLDELPEIINIIKGDMSIVGPRPLTVKYLPYYSEEERRRHDIRPGLTGLAQINGRNGLQWEERFAYDLKYVDKVTFWEDIKIIFLTVAKVVKSEGVSVRGTGETVDFDKYRMMQRQNQKVETEKMVGKL